MCRTETQAGYEKLLMFRLWYEIWNYIKKNGTEVEKEKGSADVDKLQTAAGCSATEERDKQRHLLVFTGQCTPLQWAVNQP